VYKEGSRPLHTSTGHVTHINEPRHKYRKSRDTYQSNLSHTSIGHVTRTSSFRHTYERATSQIPTGHVTRINRARSGRFHLILAHKACAHPTVASQRPSSHFCCRKRTYRTGVPHEYMACVLILCIQIYTYLSTHLHIYIYIFMYVYMYIHIHM